ncbi:MAG: hypothetical protein IK005_09090 [Paludibacteraceae bacterium]|nr:hypothetical protein [Paludibacteraceae bacterium]
MSRLLRNMILGLALVLGCISVNAQSDLDFSKVRLKYSFRIARDASKTAMDSLSGFYKIRKNGDVRLTLGNNAADAARFYYQELMRVEKNSADSLTIYYVNKNQKQLLSGADVEILGSYITSTSEMRTAYRLDSLLLKPKKAMFRLKLENKDSVVFNRVYYAVDSLLCYLHYQDKNLVDHTVLLNKQDVRDTIQFPAPIYRLRKVVLVNRLDSSEVICPRYYLASSSTGRELKNSRMGDLSEFNRRNIQLASKSKLSVPVLAFDMPAKFNKKFIPKIIIRDWPFEDMEENSEE